MLFLVEIDNSAYAFLLGERTRSTVERGCRVRLTDAEAGSLSQSKTVYTVVVVVTVIWSVAFAGRSPGGRTGGGEGLAGPIIQGCFVSFGVGALFDTVILCEAHQRNAKHLLVTTASLIATRSLGFGWYAISAVFPMMLERQGIGNG